MPQPLNRVVPNAHAFLNANVLSDKPDLAILVAKIFATWAWIEHELSLLLIRILGADADAALAMFSVLTSQSLQMMALEKAAKAALPTDDHNIFLAALAVTNSAQAPRNHLAHWVWGGCEQLPDALVLANPKILKNQDTIRAKHFQSPPLFEAMTWEKMYELYEFDQSSMLVYRKQDLERAERDLSAASQTVFLLQAYLDPTFLAGALKTLHHEDHQRIRDGTRARVLRELSEIPLFRASLDRIRGDQNNSSQ